MSADDGFLARWSRRKRAARMRERPRRETPVDGPADPAPAVPEPAVDLARLPPIGSIEAGSDITPFLAPGVPVDIARAALRRAWAADPAIRDFIGLSENSWDFTAAGGVPGFGSVTPEQVRTLLAQLTGEATTKTAEPGTAAPAVIIAGRDARSMSEGCRQQDGRNEQESNAVLDAPQHNLTEDIALQRKPAVGEAFAPLPRRRHGGALPE